MPCSFWIGTGSVGQSEYDEIANMVRGLGRRLMATGQVQVSVVLFAGGAGEENSVWYDGYENMVTHSTNPADLDRIDGARLYYYYYYS